MAFTALSELTASMGTYFELVIKPSYELDTSNNRVQVKVSYGVRKIAANSTTYNIDAGRMWASFGSTVLMGSGGTLVNWDQRKEAVGTYHEYKSYTGTVQCNSDGTSSLYLYAKFFVGNVNGAKTAEISRTISLPQIPRASTISATPTFIGEATMITIQRASPNFRHTVRYSFGQLTGIVGTEKRADTNFSWVVPTDFYSKLTGKSIVITLFCQTYDGDSLVGTTNCSFTASAQDGASKPTIGAYSAVEKNADCIRLAGGSLVRYRSVVECSFTATAKYNATIQALTVNGKLMEMTSPTGVTATGTYTYKAADMDKSSFVFTAIDTRGNMASVTKTFTLIPYEVVTLGHSITRPSSTGTTVKLNLSGRFYNGNIGQTANTLTVIARLRTANTMAWGEDRPVTTTKSGNTWSGTLDLTGLAYDQTYVVWVEAYDAFGETYAAKATITIPPGEPVFDWGKNDLTVNKLLFAKSNIRIPPGTSSAESGLFAGSSATTSTTFRMISTKNASGNDVLYIGANDHGTYLYGKPLWIYLNGGRIDFMRSTGSYMDALWCQSDTITVGNTEMGTSILGKPVTIGIKNDSNTNYALPTDIQGDPLRIYLDGSDDEIQAKIKVGSSTTSIPVLKFDSSQTNQYQVGNTNAGTCLKGKAIDLLTLSTFTCNKSMTLSSDRRNKKDIEPVSDAYEDLLDRLAPRRFRYKSEDDDAPYHIGYIAQDVLAALKDAGLDRSDLAALAGEENGEIDDNGFGGMGIAYSELFPLLHMKIKALESRVEKLEGLVAKLLGTDISS